MTPKQQGFFFPAEWHTHRATWLSFPQSSDSWDYGDRLERIYPSYMAFIKAIAESENSQTRFGFDERWLKKLTPSKSSSLSIVRVLGDSMEPTLSHRDEVLVDASDHGARLRDGIYILRSDDMLVVKRVALKPGGKQITISSDNTAYPTWDDVDRASIHIVGRVIWFCRAL